MNLLNRVKKFERLNKLIQKLDQNFLIDEKVIDDFIKICQIKKEERVIEVGAGLGFLTEKIAPLCHQLITIEIDLRFKDFLKSLPENVKVLYGDAYKLFCDKKFILSLGKIDKIIGNFPYSKLENFLHPAMKGGWFEGDIFMIGPASFVNTVNKNPIFNSYYQAFFIKKIGKSSFYPSPHTVSAIIHLKRIDDPKITKDYKIFIKRFLYEHENWKLKNCLREGIIDAGKKLNKKFITKNQARAIIKDLNIEKEILEKEIYRINLDLYNLIADNLVL
ncbi:MAG: rRNA adenine N-6-methyltransferase family protein [Microgenomates group bacterium]